MTSKKNAKNIALVAHDNKKADLLTWAEYNSESLIEHNIIATGTTGKMLKKVLDSEIRLLQSGPLGGDQQLGALVSTGQVDILVFFWDPLSSQPHDTDVKALIRIAAVWNIPVACNRSTADYIFSSPLLNSAYERKIPEYSSYLDRDLF